jgi:hypothetical protein
VIGYFPIHVSPSRRLCACPVSERALAAAMERTPEEHGRRCWVHHSPCKHAPQTAFDAVKAPQRSTCTTLMGQPQRHRTVSDNTVI